MISIRHWFGTSHRKLTLSSACRSMDQLEPAFVLQIHSFRQTDHSDQTLYWLDVAPVGAVEAVERWRKVT